MKRCLIFAVIVLLTGVLSLAGDCVKQHQCCKVKQPAGCCKVKAASPDRATVEAPVAVSPTQTATLFVSEIAAPLSVVIVAAPPPPRHSRFVLLI